MTGSLKKGIFGITRACLPFGSKLLQYTAKYKRFYTIAISTRLNDDTVIQAMRF